MIDILNTLNNKDIEKYKRIKASYKGMMQYLTSDSLYKKYFLEEKNIE